MCCSCSRSTRRATQYSGPRWRLYTSHACACPHPVLTLAPARQDSFDQWLTAGGINLQLDANSRVLVWIATNDVFFLACATYESQAKTTCCQKYGLHEFRLEAQHLNFTNLSVVSLGIYSLLWSPPSPLRSAPSIVAELPGLLNHFLGIF